MKFSLQIIFSVLATLSSAITIPPSAALGGTSVFNGAQVRIYYQNNTRGSGIREISADQPTAPGRDEYQIYGGDTRPNTPLAAISWFSAGATSADVTAPSSLL